MAFGRMAAVGVATSLVYAGVSVVLALRGFSYMSFAWAGAASTATTMLCYWMLWEDRSIFRPTFRRWGSLLNFGIYDSATALITQLADTLPYFIFGKLFTPAAVGLAQRAVMLCMMPERVVLAGVSAVALPAFAQEAREGRGVRGSYLRAIELVTAAQWPSLLLLALLAEPLVWIVLGSQWLAVAPLMRILAIALMFAFPIVLHYAMVVSVGAIRYMPVIMILQALCSIGALTLAARHGLYVAALSTLVIMPCNGILAIGIARHFLKLHWRDLFVATRKSLGVTLLCAVGPVLMLSALGGRSRIRGHGVGVGGRRCGWLVGLRVTHHPLLDELVRFVNAVRLRLGSATGRPPIPDDGAEPRAFLARREQMVALREKLESERVAEFHVAECVVHLLPVGRPRRKRGEYAEDLDAVANGLAIGLLEIGAVFQAVQRERVRLFLRQHAVPDVRHQASEQPASQGGDADPVAQPQQALRNVMIIVARRRRNGRIDEHQADNARIPAGVKHRMVGSRAQADQHHAFHPMMRLERIQHLGDVGQTGVHGRQAIDLWLESPIPEKSKRSTGWPAAAS